MQEKGMPKVCKMMPKGNQNGSQNQLKRLNKSGKKTCQKLYQKLMPKKISQVLPRDPEMSYKGTKGAPPEVRRTSLRGWPAGFFNLKRLTPAGVGGL